MASPTRSEDSPATPGNLAALAGFLERSGLPQAEQDQIFREAAFAGTARQPHNTQEETAAAAPQVSGAHHEREAGLEPAHALPAQEPPQTTLEELPPDAAPRETGPTPSAALDALLQDSHTAVTAPAVPAAAPAAQVVSPSALQQETAGALRTALAAAGFNTAPRQQAQAGAAAQTSPNLAPPAQPGSVGTFRNALAAAGMVPVPAETTRLAPAPPAQAAAALAANAWASDKIEEDPEGEEGLGSASLRNARPPVRPTGFQPAVEHGEAYSGSTLGFQQGQLIFHTRDDGSGKAGVVTLSGVGFRLSSYLPAGTILGGGGFFASREVAFQMLTGDAALACTVDGVAVSASMALSVSAAVAVPAEGAHLGYQEYRPDSLCSATFYRLPEPTCAALQLPENMVLVSQDVFNGTAEARRGRGAERVVEFNARTPAATPAPHINRSQIHPMSRYSIFEDDPGSPDVSDVTRAASYQAVDAEANSIFVNGGSAYRANGGSAYQDQRQRPPNSQSARLTSAAYGSRSQGPLRDASPWPPPPGAGGHSQPRPDSQAPLTSGGMENAVFSGDCVGPPMTEQARKHAHTRWKAEIDLIEPYRGISASNDCQWLASPANLLKEGALATRSPAEASDDAVRFVGQLLAAGDKIHEAYVTASDETPDAAFFIEMVTSKLTGQAKYWYTKRDDRPQIRASPRYFLQCILSRFVQEDHAGRLRARLDTYTLLEEDNKLHVFLDRFKMLVQQIHAYGRPGALTDEHTREHLTRGLGGEEDIYNYLVSKFNGVDNPLTDVPPRVIVDALQKWTTTRTDRQARVQSTIQQRQKRRKQVLMAIETAEAQHAAQIAADPRPTVDMPLRLPPASMASINMLLMPNGDPLLDNSNSCGMSCDGVAVGQAYCTTVVARPPGVGGQPVGTPTARGCTFALQCRRCNKTFHTWIATGVQLVKCTTPSCGNEFKCNGSKLLRAAGVDIPDHRSSGNPQRAQVPPRKGNQSAHHHQQALRNLVAANPQAKATVASLLRETQDFAGLSEDGQSVLAYLSAIVESEATEEADPNEATWTNDVLDVAPSWNAHEPAAVASPQHFYDR